MAGGGHGGGHGGGGNSGGGSGGTDAANGYLTLAVHFVTWFVPLCIVLWVSALALQRRRRLSCAGALGDDGRRLSQFSRRVLRIERLGDGLFVSEEFGPLKSSMASLMMITLLLVPWTMFTISFIFGFLMSAVEGWHHEQGIPFLQYGMSLLIQPLTTMQPATLTGKVICLVIALFTFIMMTMLWGVLSVLRLVGRVNTHLCGRPIELVVLMFVVVPCLLLLVSFMPALVLVVAEGVKIHDAFFLTLDFITTGGNLGIGEITSVHWPPGLFLVQLFMVIAIAIGGTTIGIVGAHPYLTACLSFLEGSCPPSAVEEKDAEQHKPVGGPEPPRALDFCPAATTPPWSSALALQVPPGDEPALDDEAQETASTEKLEAALQRAKKAEASAAFAEDLARRLQAAEEELRTLRALKAQDSAAQKHCSP